VTRPPGEQLALGFDVADSDGVTFVTVCLRCGEQLDSFHLADVGGRWMEPVPG
jgi:hypothetical protein